MTYETLVLERAQTGVTTLRLNRPDVHNVMNLGMIRELRAALEAIRADADTRVLILTGTGRSFCAGGDLSWMRQIAGQQRAQRVEESGELASMLADLNALPCPVIARINGSVFGGGMGLVSCADIAVAVAHARFALTEVRLGLIPATISPYVVQRIGEPAARRWMLNGSRFGSEEAYRIGLIAEAVPEEELEAVVMTHVDAFLQCAPGAVAACKGLIRFVTTHDAETNRQRTPEFLADTWESVEAKAGIAAFLDKTEPPWRQE